MRYNLLIMWTDKVEFYSYILKRFTVYTTDMATHNAHHVRNLSSHSGSISSVVLHIDTETSSYFSMATTN